MSLVAVPITAPYFSTFSPARIAWRASLCPTPIVRVTVTGSPSTATVSPARKAWATTRQLSSGESRTRRRSELSILEIGVDRVHAAEDRRADLVLGLRHRLGLRDRFFRDRPGNHHDSIQVAEQIVAVGDRDLAD